MRGWLDLYSMQTPGGYFQALENLKSGVAIPALGLELVAGETAVSKE